MVKIIAQDPKAESRGQHRVQSFGALLPLFAVLGYLAIVLAILEVQVSRFGEWRSHRTGVF